MKSNETIERTITWGRLILERRDEIITELNETIEGFTYREGKRDNATKLRSIIAIASALEKCESEVENLYEYLDAWDWEDKRKVFEAIETVKS